MTLRKLFKNAKLEFLVEHSALETVIAIRIMSTLLLTLTFCSSIVALIWINCDHIV